MKRIGDRLALANRIKISNVWIFGDGEHTFLIDTGHPVERRALLRDLHAAGVRKRGDLTAVILTHRHSDHAGNARWLKRRFGCAVVAHEADAPFLRGDAKPPALARAQTPLWARTICRFEDRFPSRVPIDDTFGDGVWDWGFRVYWSPGHTEGSVMLYHEPTTTLFSGDVVLAGIAGVRGLERISYADKNFSEDIDRCREIVREHLRQMPPTSVLCSGHGPPVREGVDHKLRRLLRK